jgi:hypothetical protein
MKKDLPLVELIVSEVDSPSPGITRTALVDDPAIEETWLVFSKQAPQTPFEFKTVSSDRRLIMGPVMIPDLPIYRNDADGEYNAIFRKNTIETIMKKWGKAGYYNSFDIMHDDNQVTTGVYLFESMMVDESRGIKTPGVFGKDFNDGTWITTLYVENDTIWEEYVKTGKLKGFSVEGFFKMLFRKENEPVEDEDLQVIASVLQQVTKGL